MANFIINNQSDTTIIGTPTQDNFTFTGSGSNVFIDALSGDDTVQGPMNNSYTNVTVQGGIGVETIGGIGSFSLLVGNQGADVFNLNAAGANITVFGGQDNDTITATSGTQALLFGNMGNDTINLNGFGARSTVFGGQNNDTITGFGGQEYLSGDLGNDTIGDGGGSSSTLIGGDGRDTFNSTGQVTLMLGNTGDDTFNATGQGATIFGGQGADIINYSNSAGLIFGNLDADTITLNGGTTSTTVFGGQGSDVINGSVAGSNNVIFGDLGNDQITVGAAMLQTVNGGDGNDRIVGSNAQDVFTGGGGTDIFDVTGTARMMNNVLTITDFATGVDQVDIGGPTATSNNYSETVVNGGLTEATAAAGGIAAGQYIFVAGSTNGFLFQGSTNTVIQLSGLNNLASFDVADITT